MGTHDLQRVAEKITQLLTNRNKTNPDDQRGGFISNYSSTITCSLSTTLSIIKIQNKKGKLTTTEKLEMEAYVEEMEEFDTRKINAFSQLATLRKVSFQQLAEELNAFSR